MLEAKGQCSGNYFQEWTPPPLFSLRWVGGISLGVFSGRYFYILFIEAMVLFKFKEPS